MLITIAIIVLLIFAGTVVYVRYHCRNCGSWKSSVVTERTVEWGTDVGGLLLSDPFQLRTERRVCYRCGHAIRTSYEIERAL